MFDADDEARLRQWVRTPNVAPWFDQGDESGSDGFVDEVMAELNDPRICFMLVALAQTPDAPFAFIQDYDVHGWNDPAEPPHPFSFLPPGSRGIDTLIGEPTMLGQGHGTGYLKQRCADLLAGGAPAIGIDPHPDNLAAIRAYQKAGFTGDRVVTAPWGLARLMVRTPDSKNAQT